MHFLPESTAESIYHAHRKWNEKFARRLAPPADQYDNDPTPDRVLRVGYMSGALRDQPVGRFLLPLLENHSLRQFQVFCYAESTAPDAMSDRLRSCASVWRETVGIPDERLAKIIRDDKIDILVDLSLHAGDSRASLFARKPAPVQVSYLAYVGTTGLDTVDYRSPIHTWTRRA